MRSQGGDVHICIPYAHFLSFCGEKLKSDSVLGKHSLLSSNVMVSHHHNMNILYSTRTYIFIITIGKYSTSSPEYTEGTPSNGEMQLDALNQAGILYHTVQGHEGEVLSGHCVPAGGAEIAANVHGKRLKIDRQVHL